MKRAKPQEIKTKVLIIGGGIAGLAAASVLEDHGRDYILVDEYPFMGGQYLRHREEYIPRDTETRKKGFALLDKLKGKENIWTSSLVFGCYNGNGEKEVAVSKDGRVFLIKPEKIIVATGAREKFLPFPGWTLPGVLSVGAVQALVKTSGALPGKEGIFAGTGPFLLAAAYEYQKAGGRVLGVFELNPLAKLLNFLPHALDKEKFKEALRYMSLLWSRMKFGWKVERAKAEGDKIKAVMSRGRTRKTLVGDFLATGYGFSPNTEVAQLCGCEVEFRAELGGFVVKTSQGLSCGEGIYACGEVTGIGGARKSMIEGKIAALSLLGERDQGLLRQRKKELDFARSLNLVFSVPQEMWRKIPDETIICRCEDVRMGDIKKAVEEGFFLLRELKETTRITMGNCQGRTCFPIVTEYLRAMGKKPEPMSIRPPLKPVETGIFVEGGET